MRPDESAVEKAKIEATELLKELIAIPSVSRDESRTADLLYDRLKSLGFEAKRHKNNVYAVKHGYDAAKPTLMVNAHHDTVKPSPSYSFDPFTPKTEGDRLYGLGSNDDGASLVSLLAVFSLLKDAELPYNLLLAASAEEEVSGENGMRALLTHFDEEGIKIDAALVGEPTGMQPAVAERGLIVLDCVARGVAGHAARDNGVNAIYKAMEDIERLRKYRFPKGSPVLGPVKISVTQIEAGRQHNVIPDECRFVVDVRTTDAYTNAETAEILCKLIESEAAPRSTRVRASVISEEHPLVRTAMEMGKKTFVSPTTSDMALMYDIPSMKMGPGESSRSHSADEYVLIPEIHEAIGEYYQFLKNLKF